MTTLQKLNPSNPGPGINATPDTLKAISRHHANVSPDAKHLRISISTLAKYPRTNILASPNTQHLRADGFALLPSALRPCLLGALGLVAIAPLLSISSVSAIAPSSITLTVPSEELLLTVSPGEFAKSDQPGQIKVLTDNITGYSLSITKTGDGALVNGNDKITAVTDPTTEDSFSDNTWGFMPSKLSGSTNETQYVAEGLLEKTTTYNTTENIYSITLGAKVNAGIPAGKYTNSVTITATTNNVTPEEKTMQEWGPDECEKLGEGQAVALRDSRDENVYTVAKLKDGKCWMVENLRLGKSDGTMTLTPNDSDITESTWTLPQVAVTANFEPYSSENAKLYIDANPVYGGYYTWAAATAGTGLTINTKFENAPSSICPKGWKLPSGGTQESEIGVLISSYGDPANADGKTSQALLMSPVPGWVAAGRTAGQEQPEGQGEFVNAWLSTYSTYGDAFGLSFSGVNSGIIRGSGQGGASGSTDTMSYGYGRSVRCLLRDNPLPTDLSDPDPITDAPAEPGTSSDTASDTTSDAASDTGPNANSTTESTTSPNLTESTNASATPAASTKAE